MLRQLYDEALMTHKKLSETDRKWLVANFNLSFNKSRDILLAYKMSMTGKIAVRYNHTLDDIAKKRNIERLGNLYSLKFAQAVPELNMLTKEQRTEIMKRINLEYSAIKNLKVNKDHRGNCLPHKFEEAGTTPYCQSFKLLCFEQFETNYIPSVLPSNININDDDLYCFDRDEIVERFSKGNYLNPVTDQPFSDYAIGLLTSALLLELTVAIQPE